jgi:hypothetical protein
MPVPRPAGEGHTATENRGFEAHKGKNSDFCGLLWFLFEKNRIKCGENAIFPQEG